MKETEKFRMTWPNRCTYLLALCYYLCCVFRNVFIWLRPKLICFDNIILLFLCRYILPLDHEYDHKNDIKKIIIKRCRAVAGVLPFARHIAAAHASAYINWKLLLNVFFMIMFFFTLSQQISSHRASNNHKNMVSFFFFESSILLNYRMSSECSCVAILLPYRILRPDIVSEWAFY